MSYNSPGLRVLYFAPKIEAMPRVNALGDVIRFHRVQVWRLCSFWASFGCMLCTGHVKSVPKHTE
jgi:hypothetical protein